MNDDNLKDAALAYHEAAPAGKLAIRPTKPMATQRDLALAYSPGVAAACTAIHADPENAHRYTARGNLVGVISNGTAVLGLGAIGPLAAKPVMEGKAVLFKKFAGIDVFDIEIKEQDPHKFVEMVASMEPTFGGINLEDIKAPECFIIEEELKQRLSIPVFHDDQHGTAIIVTAGIRNALRLVNKSIEDIKLVASGAGAAALACLNLLVSMGLKISNISVIDKYGVLRIGREEPIDRYAARYAIESDAATLDDVIDGADVFLGLSAPNVMTADQLNRMAPDPIVFALANPNPEISPELALKTRPDIVLATGRSDFPNQINNVVCFPYIFRGALDVGATAINTEMKLAAVDAISDLAMAESSDVVTRAYNAAPEVFSRENLIPKPFDPRLMQSVASAVALKAMETGVATRPIEDFEAYCERLSGFVYQSGFVMKPIFDKARKEPKRIVYAEGESHRVLGAVQQIVDDGLGRPILIGRPDVIDYRIGSLGLRLKPGEDFELVNIYQDDRYQECCALYHQLLGRKGVSPEEAKAVVRSRGSVVASLLLKLGYADAMICGTIGRFQRHLSSVNQVIGTAPGVFALSTLTALVLPTGTFFLCDSHVTPDPSARELSEMCILAATEVRRFGVEPRVAFLSHSNFGSHIDNSADKVRDAVELLRERQVDFEFDGEMHADAALDINIRNLVLPDSTLQGQANLLIMPNMDAAHISYSMLKVLGGGVSIGPMLIGADLPAHVVTNSITVRGLVNMSAMAVVEAQQQ